MFGSVTQTALSDKRDFPLCKFTKELLYDFHVDCVQRESVGCKPLTISVKMSGKGQ